MINVKCQGDSWCRRPQSHHFASPTTHIAHHFYYNSPTIILLLLLPIILVPHLHPIAHLHLLPPRSKRRLRPPRFYLEQLRSITATIIQACHTCPGQGYVQCRTVQLRDEVRRLHSQWYVLVGLGPNLHLQTAKGILHYLKSTFRLHHHLIVVGLMIDPILILADAEAVATQHH